MDHEFSKLNPIGPKTKEICSILDSLAIAKRLHPGQKNNLDALCRRYGIDNGRRTYHGALLDAEILADVYLIMTGGQIKFNLSNEKAGQEGGGIKNIDPAAFNLKVVGASADEILLHEQRLDLIAKSGKCLWRG